MVVNRTVFYSTRNEFPFSMLLFSTVPHADPENKIDTTGYIDHFHKWRPIINAFDNSKISLTNLILKSVIQKNFYTETRLVRHTKRHTKEF